MQDLTRYNTKRLIRVSEEEYDETEFEKTGIELEKLVFEDGTFPDQQIIDTWLRIVRSFFEGHERKALAVHCRSGLGRSAVLVAIALIEGGMKNHEAIDLIRS